MANSKERGWRRPTARLVLRALVALTLLCWTRTLLSTWCFTSAVLPRRRTYPLSSLSAGAADANLAVSEDWEAEESEEDFEVDSALSIPKLRRSSLKLKGPEKSQELDIDTVTAFVREELGDTVFKASDVAKAPTEIDDEFIDLKSGAAILHQWALRREPPEIGKQELIEGIQSALKTAVPEPPEPHILASLMWSCGRLKVNDVGPLLLPMQDMLPEVAHRMNAQNLTTFWCSAARIQEYAEEVDDMIPVLLDAIEEKADELTPNQLAAFIWASGQLDLKRSEVQRIKEHFPGRLSRREMELLSLKDIANFAFGLAQLDFRDAAMLEAIAETTAQRAAACKGKSATQDLPMIVMSLTRLGHKEKSMNKLLDSVASRLQERKRMFKKMPAWSLAALYWAWPNDGLEGVRDMQNVLLPEVEKRIAKQEFTYRMLERSWKGPKEWRRRVDSSVKIPA